jgi:DNA invertase Pin-like site-specific DNA recombinase
MAGILVGYARVSTCDQQAGLDAQVRDLKAAGCEEIFSEQVSAVAQRDRLKEALRFVRKGDTLIACKPDRLARSTTDLLRKAKLDGKYKGRKPTARAKAAEVIRFNAEGLQRTEIARRLEIGVASVYRVLADAKRTDGDRRVAA